MIILGSHNTMSYLKPTKWWMKIFRFCAKCQNKTIEEQYKLGVRCFDIRLWYDDNNNFILRHGIISFEYNKTVEDILSFINSKGNCYVRILLESTCFNKGNLFNKVELFKYFCKNIESKYPNIKFFGGIDKSTWTKVFTFNNEDIPEVCERYSSTTNIFDGKPQNGKWYDFIDDIFPWLYAKIWNKRIYKKLEEEKFNGILLLDFIEKI